MMTTNSCLLDLIYCLTFDHFLKQIENHYTQKNLFEYRYMCFVLIIVIGLIIWVYIINRIVTFYPFIFQHINIKSEILSLVLRYINSKVCIFPYIFYLKISQILLTIESGSAMAPKPLSLHINTFSIPMLPQDITN